MRTICLALTLILLIAGCASQDLSEAAPADGAKIIFSPDAKAAFWTSTSADACTGFQKAGKVKGNRQRARAIQPGVPIHVRGRGKHGLFVTSFVPEKGHSYRVDLSLRGNSSQDVVDITDPAHPVSVGHPDCLQQTRSVHNRRYDTQPEAQEQIRSAYNERYDTQSEAQEEGTSSEIAPEVTVDNAKIVFTSTGDASFWTSTSDRTCTGFRGAGKVNGTKPSRAMTIRPGVPIQVRGRGGSGLFVTSFVPEKGHTYRVDFVYGAGGNSQNVTDITNSAHPVSVGHPDCLQQTKGEYNTQPEAQEETAQAEIVPEVPADNAKIVFTTSGSPAPVTFWTSTSDKECTGFMPVGRVFYSGRGKILPWIASATEAANKAVLRTSASRTVMVQPDVPVQVRGVGSCDNRYETTVVTSSFVPEKGHTYHVNFAYESCSQDVTDITVQYHPVPVGHPLSCQ